MRIKPHAHCLEEYIKLSAQDVIVTLTSGVTGNPHALYLGVKGRVEPLNLKCGRIWEEAKQCGRTRPVVGDGSEVGTLKPD
ncbi:hypothetical protein EVAR_49207_1 [Eumeta japonica]|uniref:Uncharacterized protein n=1 Tax=Eumeta variegata TaxID=151549 RepID=A0A4C1XQR3_EUMVA|nr:hypothetical protein EVAR_49207_1 [Eumeta japonica]